MNSRRGSAWSERLRICSRYFYRRRDEAQTSGSVDVPITTVPLRSHSAIPLTCICSGQANPGHPSIAVSASFSGGCSLYTFCSTSGSGPRLVPITDLTSLIGADYKLTHGPDWGHGARGHRSRVSHWKKFVGHMFNYHHITSHHITSSKRKQALKASVSEK